MGLRKVERLEVNRTKGTRKGRWLMEGERKEGLRKVKNKEVKRTRD